MRIRLVMVMLLALAAWSICGAQPAAQFTPPGSNIALHKPYKLEPLPNYGDCCDPSDKTLLTDGVYTEGYFWVQKTTAGWIHTWPVAITIDLGQVEPIAGLSFSTAAGIADVAWPARIRIVVSDDGKVWTQAGDLVTLSNKRWAPAPKPYTLHRFATDELKTRGRYVGLVVDNKPYMVVDEIEVYQGPQSLLTQVPPGKQFSAISPLEYWKDRQVLDMMQGRMGTDLSEILSGLDRVNLTVAEKAAVRVRADKLRAEIDAVETVPAGFTTILPLSDLHTRVYALHAPLLRARGYKSLTVWQGYRYDPLQPLQAPAAPPARLRPTSVRMMRGEHRAEVINLTNASDSPLTASIGAKGTGRSADYLTVREVAFTDTQKQIPIASALLPGAVGEKGLKVTIPAGTTKQVWLDLNSKSLKAGDYTATLTVSAGASAVATLPLRLHVANVSMPAEFSTAIGGWDETNGMGSYDVNMGNMAALIANLREHGVNMPWNNPRAMPTNGQYDAEGNLTVPPDFAAWDEWVGRWPGAQHWGCFPNVGKTFNDEPMGTPRFNKMVGAWATAWVEHARAQGIKPSQIKILLVDEPREDVHDQITIAWSQALKATQPELVIWTDPLHPEPAKVDPRFYPACDVVSPNAPRFLGMGKAYQDFYAALPQSGCELWFYSCSGPSKLLDPASYFRGQFWLNLKYGGKGSNYWAFGDEAGNSWNAYAQSRSSYSPLFLGKTTVTDAKQMEAIREGAEDYEYFAMLRARVAELGRKGVQNKLITEAKDLLVTGPDQAVATMTADGIEWVVAKDRTVMDRVRLQALDMIEKLSKL